MMLKSLTDLFYLMKLSQLTVYPSIVFSLKTRPLNSGNTLQNTFILEILSYEVIINNSINLVLL